MKIKLYLVLLIAGIAISVASIGTALATGSITTIFASPSQPFAGKGTQYVIKFNATTTTSTVGSIKITFPSSTTTGSAQIAEMTGFPGATITSSVSSNVFTINISPPTKPTNPVFIFLAKVGNTGTSGGSSLEVTTYPNSNGVGTEIDDGTASFTIINNIAQVLYVDSINNRTGIATQTPAERLDVNGNIELSGTTSNIISPNADLKIITQNNHTICIGAC